MTTNSITERQPSGFEMGPVFAGAVTAVAITVVLTQFGAAAGVSLDADLRGEGYLASWGMMAVGVWVLLTQFLSSIIGGYIAGRLRTVNTLYKAHEVEMRDGMHGLVTWALSTLLVVVGVGVVSTVGSAFAVAENTAVVTAELTNAEENATLISAFIHGSFSLVAAALTWWAATKGGDHRDSQIDLGHIWSFKGK